MSDDQNHLFPEPQNNASTSGNVPNNGNSVEQDKHNSEERLDHLRHTDSYQQDINSPTIAPTQSQSSEIPVYSNPMTTSQDQSYQENQQNQSYGSFDINTGQPEIQKATNKDINQKPGAKLDLKKKITDFLATKWWVVVAIVLVISLISGGIYFYFNRPANYDLSAFTNVAGKIEAPATSPSGSPDRWQIVIQNQETVAIRNIEVKLNFDRSFQYIRPINPNPSDPSGDTYRFASLAGIGQGTSDVVIQFEGSLTGNIDENTLMSGTITYTPEPLANSTNSTRTVSIAESRTRITAPEINVNLTPAGDSIQNGGEVELTATFENLSERDLRDIRVFMEYPSGSNFSYTSSALTLRNADVKNQPDDGRNIWYIPVLPRLQTSTLSIKGNLFGADGVRQTFRIEIGARNPDGDYDGLATDVAEVLVTSQPLIISTRIDGKDSNKTFAPGETLNFTVDYQNKSNTTIQNVELFGLVDDPANLLDYSTTTFVGGDIGNLNNRVIQWRGSGVPQLVTLTPQVTGSVRYSIRVKTGDAFIASSLNQSSYTLRPRAQAKASNIQQFEIGGDLYQARGELGFNQTVVPQPVDPNQANRRVFRVTWELRNRQTQINDITVETISALPPTAWKQSSIQPGANASTLSYDPLTGSIRWSPGSLIGYTGISSPVKSITFDLEVVAESNASVNSTILYGELKAKGVDDFTGEVYEITNAPTRAVN